MSYEKTLHSVATDIEKDIEWREENGYKATKQERWADRLRHVMIAMDAEEKRRTIDNSAMTKEIMHLRDENFKMRVILEYLSKDLALNTGYFLNAIIKKVTHSDMMKIIEDIDRINAEIGMLPRTKKVHDEMTESLSVVR